MVDVPDETGNLRQIRVPPAPRLRLRPGQPTVQVDEFYPMRTMPTGWPATRVAKTKPNKDGPR
jgi:hypothetical protein